MSQQPLPSLMALRCVEATARRETMSAAADELHLTHGAVSRHIRNVETLLQTRLFVRGSRRLQVTPAGRALADDIARITDDLTRCLSKAAGQNAQPQTITVSCEPTLLMRWLIPRLPHLSSDVQLHLVAAGGPVAFARQGIDLAIRRDDSQQPSAVERRLLAPERVGPVMSPTLATHVRRPDDLAGQTLLHTRTRPDAWDDWLKLRDQPRPAAARQTFEHFYLAVEAAAAGLGVAIASYLMVIDALRSGTLVAPLGFAPDGSTYELLAPQPFSVQPQLAAVVDYLAELGAAAQNYPEARVP